MLFHVTITHNQADCPGRRPGETPELISPADRHATLGDELSVTSHSVVWGASCILWAEPEHVAYALLEAASLEAVERYLEALIPAGWAIRALPVFMLPSQLTAVRQLLAAPAMPFVQPPAAVGEPPQSVTEPSASITAPSGDRGTVHTLKGLTDVSTEAAAEQPTSPPDEARVATVPPTVQPLHESPAKRVTPATPQPVPSLNREARTDSGAVTRFIERPAMLQGLAGSPPPPNLADPRGAPEAGEPRSSSENPTVILDPKAQRMPRMRLVANTGPAQGTVFDVGEGGATLGRLPENSICLTDGRLSRQHARIDFRDGGYWLSDVGSQNGTLLNDHALTEAHLLRAGDAIVLGTTRLTVMLDSDD